MADRRYTLLLSDPAHARGSPTTHNRTHAQGPKTTPNTSATPEGGRRGQHMHGPSHSISSEQNALRCDGVRALNETYEIDSRSRQIGGWDAELVTSGAQSVDRSGPQAASCNIDDVQVRSTSRRQ